MDQGRTLYIVNASEGEGYELLGNDGGYFGAFDTIRDAVEEAKRAIAGGAADDYCIDASYD